MYLTGKWTKTPKFWANHISIELEGGEIYCNTVISTVKLTSNKHHSAKHHIAVNTNYALKTSIFKLRLKAENQTLSWPTRGLLCMFDLFWYLVWRWSVTVWKHHYSRSKDGTCWRKDLSPLTYVAPKGGALPEPNDSFPCSWDVGNTSGWGSIGFQDLNSCLEVSAVDERLLS